MDRTMTQSSRVRPWRLADMPVRVKAALIVLPTALAAVVSTGFGLWSSAGEADATRHAGRMFSASVAADELTQRLQVERIIAVSLLLPEAEVTAADFERAVQDTDRAASRFHQQRGRLDELPSSVQAVLTNVDAALTDVGTQRQRIRGEGPVSLSAVAFGYQGVVADLGNLLPTMARSGAPPLLEDAMRVSAALARAREAVGQQQVMVLQAVAANQLTPALHAEIVAARASHEEALREFDLSARSGWRSLLGRTMTGPDVLAAVRLDGVVSGTALYEPMQLPGGAQQWSRVMTTRANLLAEVQTVVNRDIATTADDLWMEQVRAAVLQGIVLIVMLALAVLTAFWVARSLVSQLSALEQGARRVANVELPGLVERLGAASDPVAAQRLTEGTGAVSVPVVGRDEVGRVANAFNLVLRSAVDATADQARSRVLVSAMITSIGRRVQALTERLLGSIDTLERDEEDPDRLARLFGVDQQATRLRRYGTNLLIVAGGGPGRSQRQPVELVDLVNAALSETEGFARVTMDRLVEAEIDARAADAVKSILAELLDNATRFSAELVRVSAGWSGRDVRILVADTGLGLPAVQLERANQLLASSELDVAITDQMGLVVVSRLAREFDISTRLTKTQPTGITAEVTVPAEYVTRLRIREYVVPGLTRPSPTAALSPREATVELPLVRSAQGALALPATPTPPGEREAVARSSWLHPGGAAGSGPPTAADPAVPDTGEATTAGRTAAGLPRRRRPAQMAGGSPARSTGSESPESSESIDPEAIRAQVAGTMRGLRAASVTPPLSTGER
ncbi:ATP-binding region, ATPase domain protein domain protein [Salinispora tropica CNB-440]|uniref:histidine kinase n=1 Tax=Salinispora tropica (strain ATCC BAA-916 / DSM 44818 / JCM 13857 / NBRC 105044 / CNB-440) TaxID=369723 RepID=A4X2Y4_SALTO|nr:ATP-binding region, ATPase domain protein domain protein [Salinispora tropica CNB-440]